MKIYLARNNVQAGPYSLDELNTMLASQEVLLDDLIWHSGMSQWQRLADVTHGQLFYAPNAQPTPKTTTLHPQGFGDNVDFRPQQETKKLSVEELYGRPNKPEPATHTTPYLKNTTANEYASISSRFLAFIINISLYLLTLLPLLVDIFKIVDVQKLNQMHDYASVQAYSQSLTNQISATTTSLSSIMLFSFLAIQILLIIMRGQSFGKLVMGIRVVSRDTKKLPPISKLLVVRTLILITIYFVGISLFAGIPALILLMVNYLMAGKSPDKQGWHDKMANTVVVKAQSSQLDKT